MQPTAQQAGLAASADAPAVVMDQVGRTVADVRGDGRGDVRVLREVDLTVERGRMLHIVGPSGAGKSSLIRLINRLDEATTGRIEVLGRTIGDWTISQLRRRAAMVFQVPVLLDCTAVENLRLPFELHGHVPDDFERRTGEAMGLAGADMDWLGRDTAVLSVGQQQRVALARALITEPDILLLDEPTAALDVRTSEQLLASIAELQQTNGLTVISATHRIEEARRLGGDMAVIIDGHIEAAGDVQQLLDQPPGDAVRQFLHGGADA